MRELLLIMKALIRIKCPGVDQAFVNVSPTDCNYFNPAVTCVHRELSLGSRPPEEMAEIQVT